MKFCLSCEKMSKVTTRTTKWFYNRNIMYTRLVCAGCLTELVLDKEPKYK